MNGRIKMYNDNKGYGFIKAENDRDYFFHISSVAPFSSFSINSYVSFIESSNNKGLIALSVKVLDNRIPKFISCGNTRIKISNIKEYGISYRELYVKPNYKKSDIQPDGLFHKIFPKLVEDGTYDIKYSIPSNYNYSIIDELCGYSDYKLKSVPYLYITTYQNENFIFYSLTSSFNIYDKRNELDTFMGLK